MVIDRHLNTEHEIIKALYECRTVTHDHLSNKKKEIIDKLAALRDDRISITEERSEASSQGDLSENAEYHNATAKLLQVNKDIALLEDKLHAFDLYSIVMGVHDDKAKYDSSHVADPVAVSINDKVHIICDDEEILSKLDPSSELVGDRGKTILLELEGGASYAWTLAPSELADNDASLLSCDSPVGKCLIGQSAGFQFTIVIRGKTLSYTLKGVL